MQSEASKENVGSVSAYHHPTLRSVNAAAPLGCCETAAFGCCETVEAGAATDPAPVAADAGGAVVKEEEEVGVDVRVADGFEEADALVASEAPSMMRLLAVGAESALPIDADI